jgi:hypothetical protein
MLAVFHSFEEVAYPLTADIVDDQCFCHPFSSVFQCLANGVVNVDMAKKRSLKRINRNKRDTLPLALLKINHGMGHKAPMSGTGACPNSRGIQVA